MAYRYFVVSVFAGLWCGSAARAAEVTHVASALDAKNRFDAHVSLEYRRTLSRGAIRREYVGRSGDQSSVQLAKELRFSHTRHVLSPRLEIGLWKDLQLHVELPVVIEDNRRITFELNGGDSCGDPRELNCVTPANSSLVRDGILDGSQMAADQVAVADSDGPQEAGSCPLAVAWTSYFSA